MHKINFKQNATLPLYNNAYDAIQTGSAFSMRCASGVNINVDVKWIETVTENHFIMANIGERTQNRVWITSQRVSHYMKLVMLSSFDEAIVVAMWLKWIHLDKRSDYKL